ncbi:MAG: LysR family transcriptional regulator [Rhodospirillaceae bacterium]|nr:LysR family transcriptional regulator [Rhodospirillaceae bacterium]
MFDWNDLRHLLAVSRHGSTIAAGKSLGVSQSTVHRRLGALERALGRKLVIRTAAGYRLTEFARSMLPHAERAEAAIGDFERQISGENRELSGVIRLTCPEPIVQRLMPFIDRFHARHPGLRIEFVTSDRYLDLAKGEADVAFRSGDTDDELVGRKVAESVWAIYASRGYIARNGRPQQPEELARHPLVALDKAMAGHRVAKWLAETVPKADIVARNDSVLGLMYAVKSGIGIGPLPTAIADTEPELVRVLGPIPELSRSWRLLTHPDLRRTPRIATFFDFVLAERETLKAILTG